MYWRRAAVAVDDGGAGAFEPLKEPNRLEPRRKRVGQQLHARMLHCDLHHLILHVFENCVELAAAL